VVTAVKARGEIEFDVDRGLIELQNALFRAWGYELER
jgi:hypothetical protein